jgi:hypothetical protein
MLKTYEQRVKSTYALMECFIEFTGKNSAAIRQLRDQAKQSVVTQTEFPLSWAADKSRSIEITFKGFEAGYKPSDISGLPRLYYDRTKPYEKQVKYFNFYNARTTAKAPAAYIIPQGWWKVIDLLKINKVNMRVFTKDTTIDVEYYRVEESKAFPRQYEMHHLNYDVKMSSHREKVSFRKGDYYIPMNQVANRFLAEVLEPQADDSYFAWNYFDAILSQKEGFSGYAYEDIAAEYLKSHPDIKRRLEERRASDTAFAKSANAQLDFIYKNSPNYEPDHLRYPVYRFIK